MKKRIGLLALLAALCLLTVACGKSSTPAALSAPQNLRYEQGAVRYDAVDGAVGYVVLVGDEEVNCGTALSLDMSGYTGTVAVCVKALGDGKTHTDSDFGAPLTVTCGTAPTGTLAVPTGLRYENGTVQWNEVQGAAGYTVKVNGTLVESTQTSFALRQEDVGAVRIAVSAKGNGETTTDSAFSQVLDVYVKFALSAPARFRYDRFGKNLRWESAENAVGYMLTINGRAIELGSNVTAYGVASYGQSFTASLLAVANGERHDDSPEAQLAVAPVAVTEISDEAGLRSMTANGSYKLTADITLRGNWAPMDFWGTFDGNGHTLRGITVTSDARDAGFFGMLTDAEVRNLTIDGITVTASGAGNVGALAGYVANAEITDCHVKNAGVTASGGNAGGFLGVLADGERAKVENCDAAATVTLSGGGNAGGFAGSVRTNAANLTRCFSAGTVTGGNNAGGFAGHIGYGTVALSYAQANVTALESGAAGGFVGLLDGRNVKVRNSYCAGEVTANGGNAGGFGGIVPTGRFTGGNIFENCYYDGQVCALDRIGNASDGRGDGIASLKTLAGGTLPSGFSSDDWTATADGYPTLR